MSIYSDAPARRPFSEDKPTLLVSWWITIFCFAIIILRLSGRYVRVEKLLREDKIVAVAMLPLLLRAVCVHFVLRYGTNNVSLDGIDMTQDEVDRRVIGSRLVMASRVFYAAVLWIIKYTTLEFFSRLAGATRKKSHAAIIVAMRWALGLSFIAVVVSDLAECQPLPHHWQVRPDPGPQCRQGLAQMLTMGACSVATDLVLIAFPIPIILSSQIAPKRKVLLVLLFCLVFVPVAITLYRMPFIVRRAGAQVDRTMWASVEILAATGVGNTVALGSFLRDSGVKRKKFKGENSYSGYSGSRSQSQPTRLTRTAVSRWEEDEDEEERRRDLASGLARPVKTTEGIWAAGSSGASHTTTGSISKDDDGARKDSSGDRPVSPTQSHDSLITRDQLVLQRPASVVVVEARELQRGGRG
ncbi:hypothetical protein AK830_g4404 [Neonectria ditissima]|uniref:Rhodopsin domain-containing protein n=1 Tax=Neonectria ditissima TaxID=78410 RepID=A0A0N8H7M0_9HYPO|nr:hypothetical protein AK830_g4404 [Neonectria ditissima]